MFWRKANKKLALEEEGSRSLSKIAWKRLKKNKPAMFGLWVIIFFCVISILGANIRADRTLHSDNQNIDLKLKQPGFTIKMLKVRINLETDPKSFRNLMFFGGTDKEYKFVSISDYRFEGEFVYVKEYIGETRIKSAFKETEIPYLLVDVLYPLHVNHRFTQDDKGNVSFYDVYNNHIETSITEMKKEIEENNLITKTYWLGTDLLGRDVMSRLQAGTIVSLSVGLISVLISLFIGISLGAIAGFFRGWVDDIVMWLINVVWSIPTLLLVIAVTLALDKGFWQVFVAVGLTMWVEVARIVRGQVLSIREKEFVEAGRALGFRSMRIITRHVLPNVMGPVIVISAANFASAILIESGLSFLGVGVQPPMPSWGEMLARHREFIDNPDLSFLAIVPGLVTVIMVLAFMLVGNGLRDALDTRVVDDVQR